MAQLDPKLPLVVYGDLTFAESNRIYEAWTKVSPDGLVIFARNRDEIQNLNVVEESDLFDAMAVGMSPSDADWPGTMQLRKYAAAIREKFLVWSRPVTVVADHAPLNPTEKPQ